MGPPVCGPPSHLEEVVAEALVALEGGSASEIARPELVGAICIGEEVVHFQGPVGKPGCTCPSVHPTQWLGFPLTPLASPGEVGPVQLPEIAGRGGIKDVDAAAVGLLEKQGRA